MYSLIKNKQYDKLTYKLGFFSAMLGFVEWFYWFSAFFIKTDNKVIIDLFFICAIIIAVLSVFFGVYAIIIGILALKKDADKKITKKGIIYGILGIGLLIGLWLKFFYR